MEKGKCIGIGRNAKVYEWGENEVLKLFEKGMSMNNEVQNSIVIHSLGIPSPEVRGTISVDGCEGIVYERIFGNTMTKLIKPDGDSIIRHARILANLQASFSKIEVDYKPNLKQELSDQITYNNKIAEKTKKALIDHLSKLPEKNGICHFDFHPDNVIISEERGPVIIDWANVLVGHSLADAAKTALILRSHALPPGDFPKWLDDRKSRLWFYHEYLSEYFKLTGTDMSDLEPWFPPIAAARLNEGIREEEEELMNLINEWEKDVIKIQ